MKGKFGIKSARGILRRFLCRTQWKRCAGHKNALVLIETKKKKLAVLLRQKYLTRAIRTIARNVLVPAIPRFDMIEQGSQYREKRFSTSCRDAWIWRSIMGSVI